jgi:hypothetical protein
MSHQSIAGGQLIIVASCEVIRLLITNHEDMFTGGLSAGVAARAGAARPSDAAMAKTPTIPAFVLRRMASLHLGDQRDLPDSSLGEIAYSDKGAE